MKSRICNFVRRQKGFEALQAVLLLGAAFFVIMGLKSVWDDTGKKMTTDAAGSAFSNVSKIQ